MLALIVAQARIGTAYGIMMSIQNLGFAFFPSVLGSVIKQPGGFETMELIFAGMSVAALGLSLLLCCLDAAADRAMLRGVAELRKLRGLEPLTSPRRSSGMDDS